MNTYNLCFNGGLPRITYSYTYHKIHAPYYHVHVGYCLIMCCSEKGTKPPSSSTSQNVTSQMLKSTSSMDLCKFIIPFQCGASDVVLSFSCNCCSFSSVLTHISFYFWCTQSYSLVSYHVYWYPPVPGALFVNGKMQRHKIKK